MLNGPTGRQYSPSPLRYENSAAILEGVISKKRGEDLFDAVMQGELIYLDHGDAIDHMKCMWGSLSRLITLLVSGNTVRLDITFVYLPPSDRRAWPNYSNMPPQTESSWLTSWEVGVGSGLPMPMVGTRYGPDSKIRGSQVSRR